jgi:hypothetical protein
MFSQLYLLFTASQFTHSLYGFNVNQVYPKSSHSCFTCTLTVSALLVIAIFTATGDENFAVHSILSFVSSSPIFVVFSRYTSNHH